jgi:hypothetical protein
VQATFEVGEAHGDCFDVLLAFEVLDALLLELLGVHAVQALGLGLEVEFLHLVVGDLEEGTQRGGLDHGG